jgi:ferric-dicitrate binding protein FerR (iron transport regulator)
MPFPLITELPEYEEQRGLYVTLKQQHEEAYGEVERLTNLVAELERSDVSRLADAQERPPNLRRRVLYRHQRFGQRTASMSSLRS